MSQVDTLYNIIVVEILKITFHLENTDAMLHRKMIDFRHGRKSLCDLCGNHLKPTSNTFHFND